MRIKNLKTKNTKNILSKFKYSVIFRKFEVVL